MSNMLNVDLARSMAADRDRYIAARGSVPPRAGVGERLSGLLKRMRREVAVAAPAVVAPIVLAVEEVAAPVEEVA